MEKISWIRRIFMRWDNLVDFISKRLKSDNKDAQELNELRHENSKLTGKIESSDERIKDFKVSNDDLRKNLTEKEKTISELKSENHKIEMVLEQKKSLINELNLKNQKIIGEKEADRKSIAELKLQNHKFSIQLKEKDDILAKKQSAINTLELKMMEIQSSLSAVEKNNQELSQNIAQRLLPLDKIERTFFASSGNKGKGMLGEMQMKEILVNSDLPDGFWTENLLIGNTVVEFAIKAGIDGSKWIPIDSKVLDHNVGENGKIIIDKEFVAKILSQAKSVAKYLDKRQTAAYGILVLQNDDIYMDLFKEFRGELRNILETTKVHIMSPSSFVQYAWALSNILEVHNKVSTNEKIYQNIESLTKTATAFGSALQEGYGKIKAAMETHYPSLETKQNQLAKQFAKSDIKYLNDLNSSKKYKKESDILLIENN